VIPTRYPQRVPARVPDRRPLSFMSGDLYFNGELLIPVNTTQGVGEYGATVVFDGATSELHDKNGRKVLEVPTAGPLSRFSYGNNGPIYFDGDMSYIRFDDGAVPALEGTFHEDAVKKCISLTQFRCSDTQLSGTLPDFSKCINLERIFTSDASFTGTLLSLSACTGLIRVEIQNNSLTGTLPSFSSCTSLDKLSVSNNSFSGTLPSFSSCTLLTMFYVTNNSFSSTLPSFSSCTLLEEFFCRQNAFTGPIPSFAPCTSLTQLRLNNNSWNQAEISDFIDDIYTIRVALGGNSCTIAIENNAIPDADAIAKIEGTGAYAGDGLKDNGCTVTYDT